MGCMKCSYKDNLRKMQEKKSFILDFFSGCFSVALSHNGATILHPNTKVLEFQGLFVFLWVKNNHLSPLHLFPDLLDLNLRLRPQVEKIKPLIYCINERCVL